MFKPHPKAEERKRSAVALIKYLLAAKNRVILPAHLLELLRILLYKITEAESSHKHRIRFQSKAALRCRDKTKLRHEHVFQRAKMIALLKNAAPRKVNGILKMAISCTVTSKEHARLSGFDAEYGWRRYRKAGIVVIDTKTGKRKI